MNKTGSKLSGISIVLPCHNERENLAAIVARAFRAAQLCAGQSEILVVSDGSTDGTDREARRLAGIYPNLRVIIHSENRGYGAAVMSGIKEAALEFIFFTDADGQFDPLEIPRLIGVLDGNSGVLGYRMHRKDPAGRRILGFLYTAAIRWTLGVSCRDLNCAFKIFRRTALHAVSIRSKGALLNAEILARLVRQGHVFAETGVHHYPRRFGRQSGARLDVVVRAFCEFLRLFIELRAGGFAGRLNTAFNAHHTLWP